MFEADPNSFVKNIQIFFAYVYLFDKLTCTDEVGFCYTMKKIFRDKIIPSEMAWFNKNLQTFVLL